MNDSLDSESSGTAQVGMGLSPAADKSDELVLVVDDDESVLLSLKFLLQSEGYRVLAAAGGLEAVSLCGRHKGRIAAVVTDMMMPVMDGVATIRALRALDPDLPFIAISGGLHWNEGDDLTPLELAAFIQKTFRINELEQALQKAVQ
ncbi:MAG: response regulator, partial [Verrucomicrobia bacterium]|nr:response regulator [Verrucomicrobiota bacterium]